MKNVLFILLAMLPVFGMAQNTEGVIQYEEVLKMKVELPEEMKQYAHLIPTEQKIQMSLLFNENESLYKKAEVIKEATEDPFNNGAEMKTVIIGGPGSTEIYCNVSEKIVLREEDAMGKRFLVSDDWKEREWKMLSEQKDILGYTCMKAESVTDSTSLTVWFTPQIPVAIGPSRFYGLPGVILSMDYTQEGSDVSINATGVELKSIDSIKRPSKGKKVTGEEYMKITMERMEAMEEMMGGNENSAASENGKVRIKISTRDN